MHCRYFETAEWEGIAPQWWYGGGTDITPSYVYNEDMKHFHGSYKKVCDEHDPAFYPKFRQWCAAISFFKCCAVMHSGFVPCKEAIYNYPAHHGRNRGVLEKAFVMVLFRLLNYCGMQRVLLCICLWGWPFWFAKHPNTIHDPSHCC